jgi:hypothetical protein
MNHNLLKSLTRNILHGLPNFDAIALEEFGFEKKEDHPDGYEKDEYDENSIHFATLDGNNEVIGAVRPVLNSEKGFPLSMR